MVKIQGLSSLQKQLAALRKQVGEEGTPSVVVGYTQNYAIYVHENKEAHHEVGEAKYLEKPARTHQQELAAIVRQAVSKGATLERGLVLAGLRLQREAQQLTPVDTGALRASAFTALEKDLESVSSEAYAKSQAIRQKAAERHKAKAEKKRAKKAKAKLKKTQTKTRKGK